MKNMTLVRNLLGMCLVLGAASYAFSEDAEVKLNSSGGSTKFIVQDKDAKIVTSFDSAGNIVTNGTATIAGSAFSVGGLMLVVKDGNVGIGTKEPLMKFESEWDAANNINPIGLFETTGVNSAAAIRFENASNNHFNIGITSIGEFAVSGYNSNISLASDNIRVTTSGNVGIGTTAPGAKLDVAGDINASQWIQGGCVNPNDASDIMVPVGPWCVDKYEASVWSAATGGTQYGAAVDNYPCNDNSQDCGAGGVVPVYARSVVSVTPSAYLTWFQANMACFNSGKELLPNHVWQAAVTGTPDPGAGSSAPNCNTGAGTPTTTNSGANCRSVYDIENMVGSLWEWVAEWGIYSPAQTFWNPSFNGDLAGGPSGAPIAGMVRGGAYDSAGPVAGPFAFNTSIPPNVSDLTIGFRCGRRR